MDNNVILPGSNNSNKESYISGAGYSNWADVKLEYVFPIGDHKYSSMKNYKVRGGLLEDKKEAKPWNPLKSGSTIFLINYFYKFQNFEIDSFNNNSSVDFSESINSSIDYQRTSGVEIGIQYDNTDFAPNPSSGSRQYIGLQTDGYF